MTLVDDQVSQLKFRDPERARKLGHRLGALLGEIADRGRMPADGGPLCVMHVCGSHEQAIARYGLRSLLPEGLDLIMGPGCPVCVTDVPEVDEAVSLLLADAGRPIHVATYGDMLRVPGASMSLAEAQSRTGGKRVHVVYGVTQAVELARRLESLGEDLVFFASGFETTAVATAAAVLALDEEPGAPRNFYVLSAHKYIPPAMVQVAQMPGTRIAGYLAAGHAATITGWGIFEPIAQRQRVPITVAGFEPLDVLAALARLLELIRDGEARVENCYPRCVTREGNLRALDCLWRVFRPTDGRWRGIADIPEGNLRLRPEWTHLDARVRYQLSPHLAGGEDEDALAGLATRKHAEDCRCGDIMAGLAKPTGCDLFGSACTPEQPVGACMVSSEGTCKIWHLYGGRPNLQAA